MKKLLFCQLRNHGDIIRTFPVLDALKRTHPEIQIGFTCLPEMEETCRLCASIDEVLIQPRLIPPEDHVDNTRICDIQPLEAAVDRVRAAKYDVYVDFHGVFQSALFGLLCGIPLRLGRTRKTSKDGACLFYSQLADLATNQMNRMERHLRQCQTLFPELHVQAKSFQKTENRPLAVFLPGSSRKGILKRWKIGNYIQLALRFQRLRPVFCLGKEEEDLYEELSTHLELLAHGAQIRRVIHWDEYLDLFQQAACAVGNDIAAMHLAIWQGIPAYMICGPTSGLVNGIWRYGLGRTFESSMHCCVDVWRGLCDRGQACMDEIAVEDVYRAICQDLS